MSTSPVELPEHHSAKAARLLAAATDLLIGRGARGFTVADVAARAHVGKGTVYLYWPTKEHLLVGLIGRAFLSLLDDLIDELTREPAFARPSRFCPAMVRIATSQPLVAALQARDEDLLGVLATDPRSVALDGALGPGAVLAATLPIWRRHRLARSDWEIADQNFAIRALSTGVALALINSDEPAPAADPLDVFGVSVTAILGPERANQKQVRQAAEEIVEFLREGRSAAIRLLTP